MNSKGLRSRAELHDQSQAVIGKPLEIVIFVEGRYLVVNPIDDYQPPAGLLRTLHDYFERLNQQLTTEAAALETLIVIAAKVMASVTD